MAYRRHKDSEKAVRPTTPPVDTIYPSPSPSPCSPSKAGPSFTEESRDHHPRGTTTPPVDTIYPSPPPSPCSPRKAGPSFTEEAETTTPEAPPSRGGSEVRARTPGSPPQGERDTGSEADEPPQWPTSASVEAFLLFFRQQRQQRRCGGLTDKGKSCQRYQRQAKQSEIDAAIFLLRRLPRSMPCHTLADTLRKLVLLTHCYLHDGEKTVSARVNTWLDEYFPRPTDAAVIIQKALPDLSTTCLGSEDCSCAQSLGGRAVQTIKQILSKIKDPVVYLNDKRLTIWLTRLGQHSPGPVGSRKQGSTTSQRIKMKQKDSGKVGMLLPIPAQLGLSSPGYDTSPFHLLATGRPSNDDGWMPGKAYVQTISKSLESRNTRPGFIYAYTVAGNERYVKLAIPATRSRKDMKSGRLVATERQVESPELIESLCHAELRAHRIRIYCEACQKQHVEWFDVSSDRATIAIEKWSQWMTRVADHRPNWRNAVKEIVRGKAGLETALHELTQL
ncbi:GIY-YIG nuclease family protein [Aspergillus brunneoviolaceus CBS 621.78]|uniref:Uncharacterized protein n=1 Tax=Aspergillus brunneoviolaceus CBS 621.78 TaxID=1450534 RepID=A0ACD1G711_9EURO|nr:hypothetical protein BO95DRAFT_482796 [Aspergillus brunneoviolaceus CBS 621.78]RAH44911.1 hypothetical protein BO95DRAFT_482796 [Aspergillus brunneoviolaceus CBS 621.78]